MSAWLGIAILTLFSLGLTLFMRLGARTAPRHLPEGLGQWRPMPHDGASKQDAHTVIERRVLLVDRGLFRPARLIEQRRRRSLTDGEVLEVLRERDVDA